MMKMIVIKVNNLKALLKWRVMMITVVQTGRGWVGKKGFFEELWCPARS
jgi:hypothetical protein